MTLNEQEVKSVSKLPPYKRYKYFIKRVADFEEFWTIIDKNKDIALSHIDNKMLVSFWTAPDFIKSNLNEEWKEYTLFKVDLDNFEDSIMSLIIENNYLINVFPVNNKSGFVVNLNEFTRDLNEELNKYS